MSISPESGLNHACTVAKARDAPGYRALCGEEQGMERLQIIGQDGFM